MKSHLSIEDVARIRVGIPTEIFVASDIHLSANATAASHNVEKEFSKRFVELAKSDSAIVLLNGDIFELWAGTEPSIQKALRAHTEFARSLKKFSEKSNHQVVFVIGNHDGRLGWNQQEQEILQQEFNATICFSAELVIKSPKGERKILFEHGHMLDPDNAFEDPRDPHNKPFGQYIVQEALPMVSQTQGKLLTGIEHLAEPHQFAKFVASRLLYREIFTRLWWLLIPLVFTFILELLLGYGLVTIGGYSIDVVGRIVLYTEIAVVLNVVATLTAIYFILQRLLRRAKTMPGARAGVNHNSPARQKANDICIANDYMGFVSGHTHQSEVSNVSNGFYANSGCGTELVVAAKTLAGLPKTYISLNHLSWLELKLTQTGCTISLWQAVENNEKQTKLEKFVTKQKKIGQKLAVQKSVSVDY